MKTKLILLMLGIILAFVQVWAVPIDSLQIDPRTTSIPNNWNDLELIDAKALVNGINPADNLDVIAVTSYTSSSDSWSSIPSTKTFNTSVGKPVPYTFTLSYCYLTNNLDLTPHDPPKAKLIDETGMFSIDETCTYVTNHPVKITDTDGFSHEYTCVHYNRKVTVTYTPTETGTHSAKLKIQHSLCFDGAISTSYKTIKLVGTAINPSISVSASSMTFSNKTVGKTYTAPFRLTGSNLTGDLTLKVTGATGVFSINKTRISKSEAESGACSVVVTYKPTSAGTHTATITISGGGLKTNKTISLTGSAKVRKITSSATSLAFGNKKLNTSTKKTFTVKGTNLSAPLTLTLTGASQSMFKINKTSIPASQAAGGVTVTVTYTPTSVGIHTAKITISSGDVDSKTVNLTGKGVKNSGGITPYSFDEVTKTDDTYLSKDDDGNDDVMMVPSSTTTIVNELAMNSRIYAEGLNIIIDTPIEQKAIISDIAGHAWSVDLQNGRNEIPVNASGIYIVRIREKTTKLMLK